MKQTVDPWSTYAHLRDKAQWAKCDRCDFHWPEKKLNFRDGLKICPNHSDYNESTNQKTVRIQRDGARLARLKEPLPKWPHTPDMRDVVGVSLIAPHDQIVARLSSPVMVLTGRNMTTADAISCVLSGTDTTTTTAPSLKVFSAIDPDTRGSTLTMTLFAGTPGWFDLLYNGDRFTKVLNVRAP